MQIQRINATSARNDFFNLLKASVLGKQTYLIEKGEIPMVYLIPVSEIQLNDFLNNDKAEGELLEKLRKFRFSMGATSDSVRLLREARKNGR